MSTTSTIEWTDKTWNPVRGCSVVSPGCVNCYAMKQAHRFSGEGRPYEGLTKQTKAGPQWTGAVLTVEDALLEPLSWRTPSRVFVNSMSDLFHENVPDEFIDRVFAVMALAKRHTFQVLTKRAERMRDYMASRCEPRSFHWRMRAILENADSPNQTEEFARPLPNVWLGVSVESEPYLWRLDRLEETPAAVRFVSIEPMLSHMDIGPWLPNVDWVIVGGESGPGARRCSAQWVRSIVRQCKSAKVPVFVKQMGAHVIDRNDAGFDGCESRSWPSAIEERDAVEDHINGFREDYQGADVRIHLLNRKGGDISEWPADLRVRQFPEDVA